MDNNNSSARSFSSSNKSNKLSNKSTSRNKNFIPIHVTNKKESTRDASTIRNNQSNIFNQNSSNKVIKQFKEDSSSNITETDRNLPDNKSLLEIEHIAKEIFNNMDNNTSLMDIFNKKPNKIYFQTIDKKLLEYDVVLAIKGYPSILNNLNIQTRTIQLPDWIDEKNLKDYFKYIELNYDNHMMSHNNNFLQYNFNFKKITQITNFFENEPLLYCIFKKIYFQTLI